MFEGYSYPTVRAREDCFHEASSPSGRSGSAPEYFLQYPVALVGPCEKGNPNMKVAVRYYSRSGNTKLVADAIAQAAGVEAVSVDAPNAALDEPVDVLFIGGALYAYGLDKHLTNFVRGIDGNKVGMAAVFSSAWLSRHALDLLRKELGARGVRVADKDFFVRNKPNQAQLDEAATFAKSMLQEP